MRLSLRNAAGVWEVKTLSKRHHVGNSGHSGSGVVFNYADWSPRRHPIQIPPIYTEPVFYLATPPFHGNYKFWLTSQARNFWQLLQHLRYLYEDPRKYPQMPYPKMPKTVRFLSGQFCQISIRILDSAFRKTNFYPVPDRAYKIAIFKKLARKEWILAWWALLGILWTSVHQEIEEYT
ncbi:hypothetical protein K443DRAFT_592093 [Laccaria amethystina LaAM-08-1]|uniref:Uncharacterized protein n=1 Tax=Laccaria amethystina LaAM-08-1 TaxID=1095629 RepID=A0A0C9WR72_9AGAR|nr:hypothetical protein K443DRAFT_592093 [Laccaria amethystina LaAM-08-1]